MPPILQRRTASLMGNAVAVIEAPPSGLETQPKVSTTPHPPSMQVKCTQPRGAEKELYKKRPQRHSRQRYRSQPRHRSYQHLGARCQAIGTEDELEADIRRVRTVAFVHLGHVLRVREGDIHTLKTAFISFSFQISLLQVSCNTSVWCRDCWGKDSHYTKRHHAAPALSPE